MPEFETIVSQKLEEVTVDFGAGPDSELTFSFDVNEVTPFWFNEIRRRGEEDQDVLSLSKALAEVIVAWNLTVGGEAVPADETILAKFPIKHLLAIMDAVADVPSRAEGEVSSMPSSQSPPETSTDSTPPLPASQLEPRNGEVTSPSRTPSESLSGT